MLLIALIQNVGAGQESLLSQYQDLASDVQRFESTIEGEKPPGIDELKKRLEQISESLKNIEKLEKEIENAPSKVKQWTDQIEAIKRSPPSVSLTPNPSKKRLEELEKEWTTKAEKAQSVVDSLSKGSGERLGDRKNLQTTLANKTDELAKLNNQINELTQESTPSDAVALNLRSQRLELEVSIQELKLRQNLLDIDDQLGLSQKKIEFSQLELKNSREQNLKISNLLNEARKQDAEQQAKEVKKQAESVEKKFPELAASEKTNIELADRIQEVETKLAKTNTQRAEKKIELSELKESFSNTLETLAAIGRSTSVGAMLRKRKSEIPNELECLQNASEAQNRIEDIQYWSFEVDEQLKELSRDVIRKELREAGTKLTDERWKELEDAVDELIERRKTLLLSYRKILNSSFDSELDAEKTNTKLARLARKFNNFINERIFWIRSNKILLTELKIDESDWALVAPGVWTDAGAKLLSMTRQAPWRISLGVLLVFLTLFYRPRFRNAVDNYGQVARRGSCILFWPTIQALCLTILIAVSIPILMIGAGWTMSYLVPSDNSVFDALSQAIFTAGLFATALEVLRRICRPGGLAVCHFDWPDSAVAKLKRHLKWYVPSATICVLICTLYLNMDVAQRNGTDLVERMVFLVGMVLTFTLFFKLFRPESGIFGNYLRTHEESWFNQMSSVWFSMLLGIPVALAALAFFGYYFTAVKLTEYLYITFSFGLGVELLRSLIRRFVLLRRRRAHIETARRKREAEIEAAREAQKKLAAERKRRREAGETVEEEMASGHITESIAELQGDEFDIEVNAGQANQLIRLAAIGAWILGTWFIWSDVLPAIKALDEYKLWGPSSNVLNPSPASTLATATPADPGPTESQDGRETSPEKKPTETNDSSNVELLPLGAPTPTDRIQQASVSLRDFLVFLAIGFATFFAARNLPNAFEMLFLKELPVDRSARLATKSLVSYAIVIVGVLAALRTLKIDWSSIQWLMTALTFGLAFGLQEIFANFVAGIILMFERPIRIGDLVTVDEFTGIVTRIRTRATTIVNWDRKEYIIPNKDFITGRLINWTLTDEVNRLQLNIGIAYGSDVALAKKLVLEICEEHPAILKDPATSITFEEFADSSLKLVVRTFLGVIDDRLKTVDQLHSKINTAFAKAGIEIAFPQQDLHIRTLSGPLPSNPPSNASKD